MFNKSTRYLSVSQYVFFRLIILSCTAPVIDARAGGLWLYEGSIPDMGMANAGRAASALDASTAGGNHAGIKF